jgi:hypothetical protein
LEALLNKEDNEIEAAEDFYENDNFEEEQEESKSPS